MARHCSLLSFGLLFLSTVKAAMILPRFDVCFLWSCNLLSLPCIEPLLCMCELSSSCACLHTVSSVRGHVVFKCFSEIRPSFCCVKTLWIDASHLPPFISFFLPLSYLHSFFILPQHFSHFSLWVICSRGSKSQCACELWETTVFSLRATQNGCQINTKALHHLAASLRLAKWDNGEKELDIK